MLVKFKKTGELYEVIEYAKMKNPITREWQICVIYCRQGNSVKFVREESDFNLKFESIE